MRQPTLCGRTDIGRIVGRALGIGVMLLAGLKPAASLAQQQQRDTLRLAGDTATRSRDGVEGRRARVDSLVREYDDRPNDTTITDSADARDYRRRGIVSRRAVDQTRHVSGMYFSIPEYHDEQRFQISNTEFGPIVYAYASPFLGQFRRLADISEQGEFGAFAALIEVDAPPATALPSQYTSLNLRPGANCLWIAHQGGNWTAYITQANALMGCDRPNPASPPQRLRVSRSTLPGLAHDDVPPVVRFSESQFTAPATFGQPMIGVKCLAGWCEVGPPISSRRDVMHYGFGRYGVVKGWHDEQVLAEEDGGGVLRPTVRATLIPDAMLESYSLNSFVQTDRRPVNRGVGWLPVATIVLNDNPAAGSKYANWGLRAGENYLYLRRVGTGNNDWQMSITRPGSAVRTIWNNVTRDPHTDVHVPPTARWRFASFDPDGVWVRCGEACCSGDGGT